MPKGKGKKGKKGKSGKKKKDEDKEENIAKMAVKNSNLWEARLNMMEHAREHYRETAKEVMQENEELRDNMRQIEKDTIDVVSFLKKQDLDKDMEIARLGQDLKSMRQMHQKDKDDIIDDFNRKIRDLEDKLTKRTEEMSILKNELNQVKEFRKKKIQMQKELEEIKEAMVWNEKEHKEQLARNESKFFEEKMRLQQESNKKIEELAQRAHDEAIKNLDEKTRNIYKENSRLIESLKLTTDENENTKKVNNLLYEDNATLKSELEVHKAIVKEKIEQSMLQTKQIKELTIKIDVLEKSLTQIIREFELERENLIQGNKIELESTSSELKKLRKTLELKTHEMSKIKKLAKCILDQRSDIERFFLDSLDYVRSQVTSNREEYKREANALYNSKMLAAFKGQGEYPKIRTFSKKFDANSTNNVYKDLEEAEKWHDINNLVDINDLTWEQKERVLRELFSRMNNNNNKKKKSNEQQSQVQVQAIANEPYINKSVLIQSNNNNNNYNQGNNDYDMNYTFLTQANSQMNDGLLKLPIIDTTQKETV